MEESLNYAFNQKIYLELLAAQNDRRSIRENTVERKIYQNVMNRLKQS